MSLMYRLDTLHICNQHVAPDAWAGLRHTNRLINVEFRELATLANLEVRRIRAKIEKWGWVGKR